ncbi:protein tofu-2-like isoform X1 [Xenia sp. Carnegie-2017]|uniref:protein tofu-2-like isoform X1 n=1 Tax=Xenia sp. Carnegie-2017 TaxID=2897299 RepID=UPI001F042C15|nr:protein tofu-2-like isoform X1 [Xenia sp. Carnegie-2017]
MTIKAPKMSGFYILNSTVPYEEDSTHEFKGHRNLAVEELPPWCYFLGTGKRSRRAVSRAINAFLNTGNGGTVYLGIADDGVVKGIRLSQYQKDHILVSMNDLMSRYEPKVDSGRYNVEFVPVIGKRKADIQVKQDSYSNKTDNSRLRPHLLRTPEYCWCDKDAMAQYSLGIEQPLYVIEVTVHPYPSKLVEIWDNAYHLDIHPVHQDEEGNCYFRRQASLVQYKHSDIYEQSKEEVRQFYEGIISKLKDEVRQAKALHMNLT